jgi:SMC interacting uncharacterized protein involved in chromosome segregation
MKKLFTIIVLFLMVFQALAQTREVPFTLDDRDRIMRTEEKLNSMNSDMNGKIESVNGKIESVNGKIESLRNEMNAKFEAVETKIDAVDSKFEPLYWAFGILIALMLFILGYIIWDRRTALHPIQNKTINLEERVRKLENLSREQANKDPIFAEMMKKAGLL